MVRQDSPRSKKLIRAFGMRPAAANPFNAQDKRLPRMP
jgi:hypothetical protein